MARGKKGTGRNRDYIINPTDGEERKKQKW